MQRVDPDDIDPHGFGGDRDVRRLSDPLDTSDLAINRYALDPGEAFAESLHAHLDQEELFYVVEGTATFETKPEPDADGETVAVGPDEAIRFAPGEFQQGRNESDDRVVALALGAPRETTDVRVLGPCPDCESDVLDLVPADGGFAVECPECGTTVES